MDFSELGEASQSERDFQAADYFFKCLTPSCGFGSEAEPDSLNPPVNRVGYTSRRMHFALSVNQQRQ